MMFGHAARRLVVLSLFAALPLLSACSDDDNNNPPPPTATATRSQGPTGTATRSQVPTSTATQGQVPTSTATGAATSTATSLATSTATRAPTGTATSSPTATITLTPLFTATATATATGSAAATVTATATPTGTVAATITPTPTTGPEGFRDVASAQPATFAAHGSVNQVWITDAPPNSVLELVGADSFVVTSGTTDAQGGLILREVPIGVGYHIVAGFPGTLFASGALEVTAWDDPPEQSFYDSQVITPGYTVGSTDVSGYGYFTTRDGTLIAINVRLPGPPEQGPYPTVIEYSGYDPANPDSPQPSTQISQVLGFATVGINIRGTGCSGGAFQFFEPLQSTDGYDAVEVIAAQPWVKGGKVGLVGLSYPGISQLFVAQLQPPHLAAIAPLSVISETGRGTLYPGGILNNGFATDWAADRQHDAMIGGQGWSQKRMDEGDQICIDNMKVRGQTPNILQMIADNEFYNPIVADPVTPATFVHNINVPVFLAGAWQDEQVGGYVATMLDRFTGTDKLHFTLVNGGHTEPLIPAIFARWMEFLYFYVREEVPQTPIFATAIADYIGNLIFTTSGLGTALPPDRFTGMTYADALAAFEAEPPVRVLFESGAGSGNPGAPFPAFEHSFASWPIPGVTPTRWYFAENGALVLDEPTGDGVDSFLYDPSRAQYTNYHGACQPNGTCDPGGRPCETDQQCTLGSDGIWAALPTWAWDPLPDGKALAYATAPLVENTVMIGSGSVDLWIRATATDVDLQVALSEIRPDGQEVYIQNGWLRGSRRALDETLSTDLRPVPSGLLADVEPVPSDEFVLARAELFPFAHAFRAGSRVRISITAPGGDRPLWKFQTPAVAGDVTIDIARAEALPSSVLLPVVPDVDVPTPLPPCPGLRGQPCRTYVELAD